MKTPTRLIVRLSLSAALITGLSLGIAFGQTTPPNPPSPSSQPDNDPAEPIIIEMEAPDAEIFLWEGEELAALGDLDLDLDLDFDMDGFIFDFEPGEDFLFPDSDYEFFGPDTLVERYGQNAEEYQAQMRELKKQMAEIKKQMRKIRMEIPRRNEEFKRLARQHRDHSPRIYMWSEKGKPGNTFYCTDSITQDSTHSVIIIKKVENGDTVVDKIVKHGRSFVNIGGDTLYLSPHRLKSDSIRIIAHKLENDARRKAQREMRLLRNHRAPGRAEWYGNTSFGSPRFEISDLSDVDIRRLKGSGLNTRKAYEPLGIERLKVTPEGKGKLRLKFIAPEGKELEVKIYDEDGESFYHEVLKQFGGLYDKVIQTGPVRKMYLKISQGKKAMIKKIVPDR